MFTSCPTFLRLSCEVFWKFVISKNLKIRTKWKQLSPKILKRNCTFFFNAARAGQGCQIEQGFHNWVKYLHVENTMYCSLYLFCCRSERTLFFLCGLFIDTLDHGLRLKWYLQFANPQHLALLITWQLVVYFLMAAYSCLFTFIFYYVLSPWLGYKLLKSHYQYVFRLLISMCWMS